MAGRCTSWSLYLSCLRRSPAPHLASDLLYHLAQHHGLPKMKIFQITIFATPPGVNAVPLVSASDLSSFGFLQRGTVGDVMNFMAKTVAERTPPTQRQSVQENSYTAHVHNRPPSDGVCGVIVCDTEYPVRVAFSLLNKLLDEFVVKVPKATYQDRVNRASTGGAASVPKEGLLGQNEFPQLGQYIVRYQDPRQADNIMRVQNELDETKIILHKTIESVLQRGEELDKLVERSENLSTQSKAFYKTAKKQNSCCIIA